MSLLAALVLFGLLGCHPVPSADSITLNCVFSPNPPHLGSSLVRVTLTGANNVPLSHAAVNLQGEMAHAGMVPTFGKVSEVADGVYQGSISFSMPGDWVLIVEILPAGGGSIQKITKVRVVGQIEDPYADSGVRQIPSGPRRAQPPLSVPDVDAPRFAPPNPGFPRSTFPNPTFPNPGFPRSTIPAPGGQTPASPPNGNPNTALHET